MPNQEEIALMGHLLRRAGFGAGRAEIETKAAQGYDAVVQDLLTPEAQTTVDEDIMVRYHPSYNHSAAIEQNVQQWLYRMVNSPRQLQEKMTLFWHMIFCAGHSKIDSGEEMHRMIIMFREHGMGNFQNLLIQLSTFPGMMYYLDNTESHKVALNENYGRELLELFSLGVGMDNNFNYSEDDVKACARAFTGWNVAPAYPPFPYGRSPWEFRYDPADHDDSEKTFLGQTGRWNGHDIIDIICKQPATARFIARHMYNFFVADEVPVPSWRLTPPKDAALIAALEKAYFDSGYDITAMLRVLFTSASFKAANVRYAKVKNPAELVASILRITGEHYGDVKPGLYEISQEPKYMGMDLMNPPTVEGWHTGHEWIDSGTLVERINFAADFLGRSDLPGVQDMIKRLATRGQSLSPEAFVEGCMDMVGCLNISEDTRQELVAHAQRGGDLRHATEAERAEFTRRSSEMFQMLAATAEFQFC
ncbi:MAG: DUF1800 domain-containing protein [Candidatus Tectomicrobia bacterium]|uniref:DUF1800 domain-containing protein n=1 Tax=Tectimicrobiota bacterium TaxID=2528274 RepID=A0A937VZP9_UNCTE|nr:DUF1800 domain-containing protein [Candidatus Tectomicrobia bacterium]